MCVCVCVCVESERKRRNEIEKERKSGRYLFVLLQERVSRLLKHYQIR